MSLTDRNTDRALLVLRLALAVSFIVHGHMKVFGMHHAGVEGFFTTLGIPLPGLAAWGVMILEFGGGILLAMGLFTRVLALLFVADMLGAVVFAVGSKGFVGGYETEYLLACGSLALAIGGAGAYSIDAMISSRRFPTRE